MTSSSASPVQRLALKDVTLCAVSSSNVEATIRAMEASLAQVDFAQALLFTHLDATGKGPEVPNCIRIVPIKPIRSSQAYSQFILSQLAEHIQTSHCLIVQWDGHVIDASRWHESFFDYDYIGASWPQFDDGHQVGNGGFSLRSRRLLEACRAPDFDAHHPEDIAIGRINREFLEAQGMAFAPVKVADWFAAERAGDPDAAFGYHGVFLMPHVLGVDEFWEVYRTLDERSTIWHDFRTIAEALIGGRNPALRFITFVGNCLNYLLFTKK